MKLRPALASDAQAMAVAHALAFDHAWGPQEIAGFLAGPGGFGFAAEAEAGLAGFILCRALGCEAEVLTLATVPSWRRRGVAQALLEAAASSASAAGAESIFLEVAVDNAAAIALYDGAGYRRAGLRRGYYAQGRDAPVDALVLRRDLPR